MFVANINKFFFFTLPIVNLVDVFRLYRQYVFVADADIFDETSLWLISE